MLGEKIKNKMKEKNIKKQELSDRSGVPISTLNKILYGETASPALDKVQAIARALGCTLDDFTSDRSEMPLQDTDDEVEAIRERLHKEPGLRALFSAAEGVRSEDLLVAAEMVRRFKKDAGE